MGTSLLVSDRHPPDEPEDDDMSLQAGQIFHKRFHAAAVDYANSPGVFGASFHHGELCGLLSGAYMVNAITPDEFSRGFELITALTQTR